MDNTLINKINEEKVQVSPGETINKFTLNFNANNERKEGTITLQGKGSLKSLMPV